MYKIDDEFRPRGRVFMKATRETNLPNVPVRKSSLKKAPRGPAITTNLDDRNIQFQHEVTHEKTVQAIITDYPSTQQYQYGVNNGSSVPAITSSSSVGNELVLAKQSNHHYDNNEPVNSLQAITRNKRLSTEVLGSSLETTKTSQRAPDGHRRITTHILRTVTTLSRAEESAQGQDMIREAKDIRTTEMGYESTRAIEPKRVKVKLKNLNNRSLERARRCDYDFIWVDQGHISDCSEKLNYKQRERQWCPNYFVWFVVAVDWSIDQWMDGWLTFQMVYN